MPFGPSTSRHTVSKLKRKNTEDHEEAVRRRDTKHRVNKMKSGKNVNGKCKRHKSQQVHGEPLPLKRIVESLDHESLQTLVVSLLEKRADISHDLLQLLPKIGVDHTLRILEEKMKLIVENLPYKVDPTSDYSYLRVQKPVVEFFNSFSDYILNFLEPVESDNTVTLKFLNEFLMNIFHKMPIFKNLEFRFFYDLSIEKINLIFVNYLSKFLKSNRSNILMIIRDDWLGTIDELNKLNHLQFQKVYDFVKLEVEQFNEKGYYYNSDLDEEEDEIGETHKLIGLSNLVNFSEDNSPLIGSGSAVGEHFLL